MQSNDSRIKVLAEAPALKAIMTMALPVILAMLVQVLYNMVDTFFIGMMKDVDQLAAANIGFPFFMITMAMGSIIGVGASSAISRYIGMKKMKEAGEIVGLSFMLVCAIGIVFTILGIALLDPVVALLGAKDSVVLPTRSYMMPLILGAVIIMANFSVGMTLRAEGAAMDTTIGMIIGSVTNIILDPIMIFTFGWGIAGAAWATVIGNAAGLAWYLFCYAKKSLLKVSFGKHSLNSTYFREIFSIGIPSGLNQGLMSVSSIITNNLAATYGTVTLAGMGIAGKVNSLIILILVGLAAGCQPLFGYNYGARNRARLSSILKTAMILAFGLGSVMLAAFTLAGKTLIAIFTPIPEVIAQGAYILTAYSCAAPVIGIIMIATNCIQAMGKAIPALILSTGRQGIYYIPLLFLLNALFGFNGFIFTQPIVDALMVVTATLMLRAILRRDPALNGIPENVAGTIADAEA
jgi:putative MATE family efflux protein